MQVQVKEWGNSQGIRLPKELLKSAGISLNEFLDVVVSNGSITLVKSFRHKTLEERAAELHIWMSTENTEGYIQCEKLALLDLTIRGHKKIDRLSISEMMNVSDAIQGIFEYNNKNT